MPVVSVKEKESSDILVKLGYPPIASQDLQAVRDAWRRVDHPLRFFSGFARAHSLHRRSGLLQDALKLYPVLYVYANKRRESEDQTSQAR